MRILYQLKHFFHPQRSNNHRPHILTSDFLFVLAFACAATIFSLNRATPIINDIVQERYGLVLGITSDITQDEIINLTNKERIDLGLHELKESPVLAYAAEQKAKDMFNKQYWAHVSPQGKHPWDFVSDAGYSYAVAGENLARDFQHSDQVIAAWMASPTHKANILHHKYSEIGISVIEGELEGIETTLVVQMFATPANSMPIRNDVQPKRDPLVAGEETTMQTEAIPTQQQVFTMPVISPVAVSKAVFLTLLLLVISTLMYDFIVASRTKVVRVVGKNMAHVFLFLVVVYLVLYYKTGYII